MRALLEGGAALAALTKDGRTPEALIEALAAARKARQEKEKSGGAGQGEGEGAGGSGAAEPSEADMEAARRLLVEWTDSWPGLLSAMGILRFSPALDSELGIRSLEDLRRVQPTRAALRELGLGGPDAKDLSLLGKKASEGEASGSGGISGGKPDVSYANVGIAMGLMLVYIAANRWLPRRTPAAARRRRAEAELRAHQKVHGHDD